MEKREEWTECPDMGVHMLDAGEVDQGSLGGVSIHVSSGDEIEVSAGWEDCPLPEAGTRYNPGTRGEADDIRASGMTLGDTSPSCNFSFVFLPPDLGL